MPPSLSVCACVCVPVNEAWAWQQRVRLAGLGQGQGQAAGWAWQCSQALSHCTATEPIEQREGEWDERGGRKGPCQLALCGTQSICLPRPVLCVSRYWQLKPLVCFFRCVCVCVRQKHKIQIKNCKNKSKNISSIFLLDFLLRDVFLPAALTNTPTHTHAQWR